MACVHVFKRSHLTETVWLINVMQQAGLSMDPVSGMPSSMATEIHPVKTHGLFLNLKVMSKSDCYTQPGSAGSRRNAAAYNHLLRLVK